MGETRLIPRQRRPDYALRNRGAKIKNGLGESSVMSKNARLVTPSLDGSKAGGGDTFKKLKEAEK